MTLITGVVLRADGEPVPGARVYVVRAPGAVQDVAALTDDEGRFSLAAPDDGTYTVECRAGQDDGPGRETVTVHGGRPEEIRLRLPQ